jgi:hypothetical protein
MQSIVVCIVFKWTSFINYQTDFTKNKVAQEIKYSVFSTMENKEKNPNQLDIELSSEVAEGIYSNLAIITHSNSEFVVDFIKILPGIPKGLVKSRIILTPNHAKRLLHALQDNLKRFEENFGEIENSEGNPGFPINFGGMTGQA